MRHKILKFGESLKVLRSKNNISQEDLANKLYVTRQTISKWESNLSSPDIEKLVVIQSLFGVSYEELLHGKIHRAIECNNYLAAKISCSSVEKAFSYIEEIEAPGFYDILDSDINEFFPVIDINFSKVMVLAMELKKMGYTICSVFGNGFGIYLSSNESANKFRVALYDIIDSFIHHDGTESSKQTLDDLDNQVNALNLAIVDKIEAEIFGPKCSHYWVDENESIRGYGQSEEACRDQAKNQDCSVYAVFPKDIVGQDALGISV